MKVIATNPAVLEALASAARRRVTAAEVNQQKIDFIVTSFGETEGITRERVVLELEKLAGVA